MFQFADECPDANHGSNSQFEMPAADVISGCTKVRLSVAEIKGKCI